MVRSALVWLGHADPVATQEKARAADPTVNQLGAILSALHAAFGSEPRNTKTIVETAGLSGVSSASHMNENLREALIAVAADGRGGIESVRLGRYLRSHQGRIVDGLRLESQLDRKTKQPKWLAVPINDGGGYGG
jgi:putative DNA primase/helicase